MKLSNKLRDDELVTLNAVNEAANALDEIEYELELLVQYGTSWTKQLAENLLGRWFHDRY